jgi:thermitase
VSGTSFASPVTAGTIALMMSANPSLANTDIERILNATAVDLGTAGRDVMYGFGRVDAAAAVKMAMSSVSTVDRTAPTVAIAAPLGSSSVSALVPVNVNAADNVGVSRVELRVNGALVATDSVAPFALSWDSTRVANGMSNLVATAFDAAGNSGTSAIVAVNVANVVIADTTPPSVTISNPTNGAKVNGNVSVSVAASDNSGAAGITQTLMINGKTVATATGGTLSYNWNTRKLATGTYSVQAVARDAAGNVTTQAVQVTK